MHWCLMKTSAPTPVLVVFGLLLLALPQSHSYPAIHQGDPSQLYKNGPPLDKAHFQPPLLEDTIEEVQKILSDDPSLPRLTRGEIEELYEKVTREEYQKSIAAGDMGRADSMRALMLVLPYNTDNNTEENLQELYTRPPVTRVIDSYTPPQPIKFITPDPHAPSKTDSAPSIGNLAATTYKPLYSFKFPQTAPNPTTYHPQSPPLMYQMTPAVSETPPPNFKPITNIPLNYDYRAHGDRVQTPKTVHRFSSHYNAKNADFLRFPNQRKSTSSSSSSTVKPVADVLESLGIISQTAMRNRSPYDDYFPAESAPQPVVSSYVPPSVNVADLKNLRLQSAAPQIRPDAYSSFKPLNIGEEIRAKPEVEGYLTRFGIVGGRKRKAMKKGQSKGQSTNEEQISEESEIATAKVPSSSFKSKKGSPSAGNVELAKLLENLQELERLNVNTKSLSAATTTTRSPPVTTARPSTTTTTTTTTPTPLVTTPSSQALITNGAPMLIEPKKPRRRIDPNIDINFGASSNHQTVDTNNDQLSKLLENLQELEKLRINPENVLKTVGPSAKTAPLTAATPSAPARSQTIINRFGDIAGQLQLPAATPSAQLNDAQQLQLVLKQLQAFERANAKTTTTPPARTTTTTTTKKPSNRGGFLPSELFEIQKLLSDDRALERLYDQARARTKPKTKTPTTTTTTTTSTRKPSPSVAELEQLQKYLAELERVRTTTTPTPPPPRPTTTTTTTSSTTSTSTTTTTTTPKPSLSTADYAQRITNSLETKSRKPAGDNEQLQALINRVQELERLNSRQNAKTTEAPLPHLGFTTRNVNGKPTASDYRVPTNDFAQLQQLYRQVQDAEQASFGQIEISTAATASKYTESSRSQNFAQRIIDITNDTGSGSSLQQVDANDFVQLQKLLSKVQELERVKIQPDGRFTTIGGSAKSKSQREATIAPNLVTSASVQTTSVHNFNGAHIVYPEKQTTYSDIERDLLLKDGNLDDLRLDLPAYMATTAKPHVNKKAGAYLEPTSSEELRELSFAQPANPKTAFGTKAEYQQYQQFFSGLDDAERNSYQNMQPPVIQKTVVVTKEPPRFVATRKPQELLKKNNTNQKKADLEELQKLLNNAQELEKLGITLPTDLSMQIETKLLKTSDGAKELQQAQTDVVKAPLESESPAVTQRANLPDEMLKSTSTTTTRTESTSEQYVEEEPKHKTVVFSVTTAKSLVPKEPKPVTESSLELPVLSATKIIEDAIKRAVNKIGVPTEQTLGFQRRSDTGIFDMAAGDDDLVGEFSELNYQLAMPNSKETSAAATKTTSVRPKDSSTDLTELQRLIGNLQELQKLNISISPEDLREADKRYLETFKTQIAAADEVKKNRRQSAAEPAESTSTAGAADTAAAVGAVSESTTTAPTRISLNLDLDDDVDNTDTGVGSSTTTEGSTTSTSTTTEESRNGSLADLEDSFGPDPNTETPLPPKKKNGFYFLADWNSFLEVGDGDDQVVVRLSPKIGDPRLFLPVKIP